MTIHSKSVLCWPCTILRLSPSVPFLNSLFVHCLFFFPPKISSSWAARKLANIGHFTSLGYWQLLRSKNLLLEIKYELVVLSLSLSVFDLRSTTFFLIAFSWRVYLSIKKNTSRQIANEQSDKNTDLSASYDKRMYAADPASFLNNQPHYNPLRGTSFRCTCWHQRYVHFVTSSSFSRSLTRVHFLLNSRWHSIHLSRSLRYRNLHVYYPILFALFFEPFRFLKESLILWLEKRSAQH